MKHLGLLLIAGSIALPALSSCRAYQKGEDRSYEIEWGPQERVPPGEPRDYSRYGISPDGKSSSSRVEPEKQPLAEYPIARETKRVGYVESPFEPGALINISGFESGSLAKDPSTGKIFLVP